jgi:hypothetical protein
MTLPSAATMRSLTPLAIVSAALVSASSTPHRALPVVSPQAPRLARQLISMRETYDFEYTGTRAGVLQLEVRASPPPGVPVPPRLLIRVPIRVEP